MPSCGTSPSSSGCSSRRAISWGRWASTTAPCSSSSARCSSARSTIILDSPRSGPDIGCHMSDYRIEKLRRELGVVLRDGSRLAGDVFLRPVSRHRSRPEDPADLVNDTDPFFALMRHGEAVLIAKAQVASAVTTVDEDDAL